jgi:hypothetical protein
MRKNILFCFVLFLSFLSLQAQQAPARNIPDVTAVATSSMIGYMLPVQPFEDRPFWTAYVDKHPEFGSGPIVLGGQIYLNSPAKVKMSLYVPKSALEFPDHNKRFYMQGWTECPSEENDITNLQKIYEVPGVFDVEPSAGGNYSYVYISGSWDGKTDPQFTGGVSKHVYDCVTGVVENIETGEILNTHMQFGKVNLYEMSPGVYYTPLQNSVKADIYFVCKLPIKAVTAFIVDDYCAVPTIKWADFQVSGEQALLGSSLGNEGSTVLKAYKTFDNMAQYLENPTDGLYHISWEIMGRNGKPYDAGSNSSHEHYLGLIVEGTEEAVEMTGKTGYITETDAAWWIKTFPRPLSAAAIETGEQYNGIEITAIPGGVRIATRNGFSAGNCIVYGVSGKKIFRQEITGSGMEITSLPPGAYVVQVHTREAVKTEKIIVQ